MWHSKTSERPSLRATRAARKGFRGLRKPSEPSGSSSITRARKKMELGCRRSHLGGRGRRRDTLRLAEGGKARVNGEAPQITGRPPVLSAPTQCFGRRPPPRASRHKKTVQGMIITLLRQFVAEMQKCCRCHLSIVARPNGFLKGSQGSLAEWT
jgi:hypothetical protein